MNKWYIMRILGKFLAQFIPKRINTIYSDNKIYSSLAFPFLKYYHFHRHI